MAPEVKNTGKYGYSTKADVFSFGIILWELIEHKKPERDDIMIAEGEVQPFESPLWKKSPEYAYLTKMCLRYHPQKRPPFFLIINKLNQAKKYLTN